MGFAFLINGALFAQFSDQTATKFAALPTGIENARLVWADVNNDGILDFLAMGQSSLIGNSSTLYVYNTGSGTYLPAGSSGLTENLSQGDAVFGDYDRDGKIDLAVMGEDPVNSGTRFLKIYRNIYSGFGNYFSSTIQLPGVSDGSLDWGDMDNDGDLDLLVVGLTGSGAVSRLYQNQGGSFLEVLQPVNNSNSPLTGVSGSDCEWGDYDNDGDLDILLIGKNLNNQPIVRIFKNLGNATFTNVNFLATGYFNGSASWGDFDNDGFLDILMAGATSGSTRETAIYKNVAGSGTFTLANNSITGIENGQAVWGDLNNDGFLDVALVGQDGPNALINRIAAVFYSLGGTGSFSAANNIGTPVNGGAAIALGDYDGDRRLDILLSGSSGILLSTLKLYRNTVSSGSTALPAAPTGLSATQVGDTMVFSWTSAGGGMSYNLVVGTSNTVDDRKEGESNLTSGFRKIVKAGNAGGVTTWKLVGLTSGTYFWKLQRVDQRFQGSPFTSAASSFTYTAPSAGSPLFVDQTAAAFGVAPSGIDLASIAWGDYDNDGDLDFVASGQNTVSAAEAFAYKNNGNGTFTRDNALSSLLGDFVDGQMAFGDFDGDGDLDLAAVGRMGSSGFTQIYANLGASLGYSFVQSSSANPITDVRYSSLAWADYDNDGDDDLLITGSTAGSGYFIELYNYDPGSLVFVKDLAASASLPTAVDIGSVAFADYNKDGWLDLAIIGRDGNNINFGNIYKNNGNGTFQQAISIPALRNSSLDWGDYNNDGYPDLLVTGNSNSGVITAVTLVLLNVSGLTMTTDPSLGLAGVYYGKGAWGDYNSDGYLDILLTGGTSVSARTSELYQNNRQGGFVKDVVTSASLTNVGNGSMVAWGDYDDDGKLDFLLAGNTTISSSGQIFKLYRNVQATANTTPLAPLNPRYRLAGFAVDLNWDAPPYSGTGPKLNQGYTYNLYVKKSGAGTMLKAPVSDTLSGVNNGYRRVVRNGNTSQNRSFRLQGLTPGWYSWGVQGLDQDFEGSPFVKGRFYYDDPTFISATNTTQFPLAVPKGLSFAAQAWGDYDNNGELDLVVSGETGVSGYNTWVYRQFGTKFILENAATAQLPQVARGALDWADFDNDGDLDLAIAGETATGLIGRVFINNGSGSFSSSPLVLAGMKNGSLKWGDFNNDGFADLLMVGETSTSSTTRIYVNGKNGTFSDTIVGFTNLKNASADWGDYNVDGYLDFVVSGENSSGNGLTQLWTNNKRGGYNLFAAGFPSLKKGSIQFGDYNRDGYPDLVITGIDNSSNPSTYVYRNQSGTNFVSTGSFTGVYDGSSAWGDYNLDGYLDLIVVGQSGPNVSDRTANLYAYVSGSGTFREDTIAEAAFSPVTEGASVSWVDYDRNGKLDLMILGSYGFGPDEKSIDLFTNIIPATTSRPTAPLGLTPVISGYDINFTWSPPAGGYPIGTVEGLTYNLYVGSSPSAVNLRSPMSNSGVGGQGFRRVVNFGRNAEGYTWTWKNVPNNGTYYWSLQAIDADFQGSDFASEQSLVFEKPAFVDSTATAFSPLPTGLTNTAMAWADYDLDGDLDLVTSGLASGGPVTTLYRNDGALGFTKVTGLSLRNVSSGSLTWCDYNRDQRPDLLITGNDSSGQPVTVLYRNNGGGALGAQAGVIPVLLKNSVAAWADYDRDGDEDLAIIGEDITNIRQFYLLSNSNGVFTSVSTSIQGLRNGALAWGDYNKDGFPDLALMGEGVSGKMGMLWRNDRNGNFVDVSATANLPALDQCSLSWADFNRDGYTDLLFTGNSSSGPQSGVWRNNTGSGTFTNVSLANQQPVSAGQSAWCDFNNDGWIDFVQTGLGPSSPVCQLFSNDQSGSFQDKTILALPLADLSIGASIAWGDYNGDGKADLAMLGSDAVNGRVLKLYKNVESTPNTLLAAPTLAAPVIVADTVFLSWTAPAGAPASTTYQLYIGTTAGGTQVASPLAAISGGYRRLVSAGGAGALTRIPVLGLAAGTYFWSVQAVDQDFEGSPFATGSSFSFVPPNFVNVTTVRFSGTIPAGIDQADLTWVDWDGDADPDLVAMGKTELNTTITDLYRNTGGTLTRFSNGSTDLPDASFGAMRWADYDLDGDMDVLILGETQAGGREGSLYKNDGSGRFSADAAASAVIVNATRSDAVWIDLNLDGKPDLVVAGDSSVSAALPKAPVIHVYQNTGGALVPWPEWETGLPAVYDCKLAKADFNADGYPDLVITGQDGSNLFTRVLRHNGVKGGFTEFAGTFTAVKDASIAAADYNLDGYPDLLISGESSFTTAPVSTLYRFDAAGNTFQATSVSLLAAKLGSSTFADINDDGYPDILISGRTGASSTDRGIKLYLNNQAGSFTEDIVTNSALKAVENGGSVAWADFTGDGKIDLALAGTSSAAAPRKSFLLFQNRNSQPNFRYGAPLNLSAVVSGDSVVLSWDAPAAVAGAGLVPGLSYQVYVRESGPNTAVISPEGIVSGSANGRRYTVDVGHAGQKRQLVVRKLETGSYNWSVQAVEPDFEGSPFAAADSFQFTRPVFLDATTVDVNDPGLSGWNLSALAWADIDLNGWQDLVVTGQSNTDPYQTRIYLNEQGKLSVATALEATLPDVRNADLAWGDFNLDGYPDLAMTGDISGGTLTRVYKNEGGTGFTQVQSFPGMTGGSIAWGDADLDGDLDLALAGDANGTAVLRILENKGTSGFASTTYTLTGLKAADIEWADLNLDGWNDLVVSGLDGANHVVRVYYNNGLGALNTSPQTLSAGASGGQVAVSDFNLDGRPDILVSGTDASGPVTLIYRNEGGSFTNLSFSVQAVAGGSCIWGDYNDDGFTDIFEVGNLAGNGKHVGLYASISGSAFELDTLATRSFVAVNNGASAAWADYNHDGKLDVAVAGLISSGPDIRHFGLFRNIEGTHINDPNPPKNLISFVGDNYVELSWERPVGSDSLVTNGFTYNIILGTAVDSGNRVAAHAFSPSGTRLVTANGNAGQHLTARVYNLPEGVFYWSVQTVDQDYEGSVFAQRDTFLFTPKAYEDLTLPVFGTTAPAGLESGALLWLDYDRDGDQDLFVSGDLGGSNSSLSFYENTGGLNARLLPKVGGIAFQDVAFSNIVAVDYDRDGDEDLLVSGQLEGTSQGRTFLLKNQDNQFIAAEPAFTAAIPDLAKSTISVGDYNQDGWPDLAVMGAGNPSGAPFTRIFRYTANGWVVDNTASANLPDLSGGDLSWGDYDRDGDPDLVISGLTAANEGYLGVFENMGDGTFRKKTGTNFEQVQNSSVEWGDMNNDGYLDLLFSGESSSPVFDPVTRLYKYDLASQLFVRVAPVLTNASRGCVKWGDYNSDGFTDILISGKTGPGAEERATLLFRNNQSESFLLDDNTSQTFAKVENSAQAFSDFDGDGTLDFALIGRTSASPIGRTFKLYHNIDTTTAVAPSPPTSIDAAVDGADIVFIWHPPADYPADEADGLTYNLWIGVDGKPFELISPASDTTTGYRRITQDGNMGHVHFFQLLKPLSGTYTWAVQTVDPHFQGSEFTRGGASIVFNRPIPVIIDSLFPPIRHQDTAQVVSYIRVADTALIAKTIVHFKGITSGTWQTEEVPYLNGRYSFNITAAKQDEQGIDYYYEVVGKFTYKAFTGTHHTYLRLPDPGLPGALLRVGKKQEDYNIISFPLILDDDKISSVFEKDEDFGKYNIYRWRMWDYANGQKREYTDGLSTLEPGKGYWLATKKAAAYQTGGGVTVTANDDAPFVISMKRGWNLVGNPYRFNLSWPEIAAYNLLNGDTVTTLYTYNTRYLESSRLDKYVGGFVFAENDYDLLVPIRKNPDIQRNGTEEVMPVPIGTIEDPFWRMNLVVTGGDLTHTLGGFGMAPEALASKDAFDRVSLPKLGQYLEPVFLHEDYFYPKFMRDVVASDKQHVWDFTVESSLENELIHLNWSPEVAMSGTRHLVLFDRENQLRLDMGENQEYAFLIEGGTHRFQVFFGTEDEIAIALKPEFIAVGAAFPNPLLEKTKIPLALPEGENAYSVTLTSFDLNGKKIRENPAVELYPGFAELSWEAIDSQGNDLPSGMYMLKIIVQGSATSFEKTLRVLKR